MRELRRFKDHQGGRVTAPLTTTAVSRWLLAIAVGGSALAVGAVHAITLCVVAALLAAAAFLAWWRSEPTRVRTPATVLLITGIGLTVYSVFQCVPMPIGWLASIAPHNADVWSRALVALREAGPSWAPLSLDPGATRVEVLRGVTYTLAFVTAVRVARQKEGVAFLTGVVIITGLLLAAAALLHPAFGAKKLFGLYEPPTGILERHVAPLMNPNNLAGYLNLALCLALARTLAREPRFPRPLLAASVLLLVATQLWVASRGGVVAMVAGVLIVAGLTYVGRASQRRGIGAVPSLITAGIAALAVVLIVLGGSEDATNELMETDSSKFLLFRRAMHMLPSVPLFGCGRGAFESAFPAFRTDLGYVTFSHPENVVAQWVLEWGVPVGLAALAAVAIALRPRAMLARSGTSAGAWAALVALALQNLGDLGTEIPGVMLGATVCAAIVVGGTPGSHATSRVERWAQRPFLVALVAVGAAVCAIGGAFGAIGRSLHEDQRALHDAALVQRVNVGTMHDLARAAMLRHPGEPYLPFAVALRASTAHDESPIPWVEATLERAGTYGPAHLVLARALAGLSPSQARLEYRLAIQQAPGLLTAVMAEAPRLVRSYDGAKELVPDGELGSVVMGLLIPTLTKKLPATAARLDRELAARLPRAQGPRERIATWAVEDAESATAAPWCAPPARDACIAEAVQDVRALLAVAPDECVGYVLEARIGLASGNRSALSKLESSTAQVQDRTACLHQLVLLSIGAGDEARADATIQEVLNAGCNTDEECSAQFDWAATVEETRGHVAKALALFEQSCKRNPQDSCLENVARLASREGLHAEAADAYERLARSHPDDSRWPSAVQRERNSATWGIVQH